MTDDRQRPTRSTTPPPGGEASASDFGRFVSSSASKSFRQLSRERQRSRTVSREQPVAPEPDVTEPPPRSGPIGRRWRDAAGIPDASVTGPELSEHDVARDDSGGGEPPMPLIDRLRDEHGRPRREVIAAAIAILLLIVLIIFLATRGDDPNEGDGTVTPTATNTTSVLGGDPDSDDAGTPNATRTPTSSPDADAQPTRDAAPTSTGEDTDDVQVGGDNQKD